MSVGIFCTGKVDCFEYVMGFRPCFYEMFPPKDLIAHAMDKVVLAVVCDRLVTAHNKDDRLTKMYPCIHIQYNPPTLSRLHHCSTQLSSRHGLINTRQTISSVSHCVRAQALITSAKSLKF